jgi:hypothetical protein
MTLPRIVKRVKPWLAAGATSRRISAASQADVQITSAAGFFYK